MNFINILVIAVSVLTILSAIALVFGSTKAGRPRSLWFLAAAIGEVIWAVSIALMLSIHDDAFGKAVSPWLVKGIYIGAIIMDSTILGYVAWKYKFGRAVTTLFLVVGLIMITALSVDPSILYSSINLSNYGNSVTIDMSRGFYFIYIAYFIAIVPSFCFALVYRIRHTKNKNSKKGYLFFLCGLAAAGFLSLVFDLIMPIYRYDLIWVGPLAIGLIMLGFYYAVLRYRMIQLSMNWLRFFSSVVIFSSGVIIYLLIFHLVFSALFKVASPSFQVILLNFIMIAIVLLLAPAITEIMSLTRSLIMTKQIDVVYIIKKLTNVRGRNVNLKDISGFLAEHMHLAYVGILVGDKMYIDDEHRFAPSEVKQIAALGKPEFGVWQDLTHVSTELINNLDITRVAGLTDPNGKVVGQIVLGRPTSKSTLDHNDLAEIEMVISLMRAMIGNGGRKS